MANTLFLSLIIIQVILLILYIANSQYDPSANATGTGTDADTYSFFQDIHIMIVVGFGFLMTYLRKYGFASVGLNFLITAIVIQWAIWLINVIYDIWHDNDEVKVEVGVGALVVGDFAAAAVLITYGALLGKVTPVQMVWLAIIEILFYAINERIVIDEFEATDVGGSIVIHAFGAYFGLAVAKVLGPKNIDEKNNESVYHSDLFSMIGTIFLWAFWPSFNGIFGGATGQGQTRAVVNTVLSISASCVAAFMLSGAFRNGKINMVDVQNATLAGGVAVGTSANLMIEPWGAILIGMCGGALSTFGFSKVSDFLQSKIGLHDTAGVHNLHGMPAVLAAIFSAIFIAGVDDDKYGVNGLSIFPGRDDYSQGEQAGYQIISIVFTVIFAIITGALTGLLLKSPLFQQTPLHFTDKLFFDVPEEEIPLYHADGENNGVELTSKGKKVIPLNEKKDDKQDDAPIQNFDEA